MFGWLKKLFSDSYSTIESPAGMPEPASVWPDQSTSGLREIPGKPGHYESAFATCRGPSNPPKDAVEEELQTFSEVAESFELYGAYDIPFRICEFCEGRIPRNVLSCPRCGG